MKRIRCVVQHCDNSGMYFTWMQRAAMHRNAKEHMPPHQLYVQNIEEKSPHTQNGTRCMLWLSF